MFRTLSPKQQPLNSSEKTAPRRKEWVRLYTSLQQREQAVWTSKNRYQVKEFMYGICFLCMERCKPLGPLSSFLSYAAQLSGANPVFLFTLRSGRCFLHSPSSWAVTMGSESIHWISFGSPHSYLEARNCWWLWHFLFTMTGDIFISHEEVYILLRTN